MQGRRDPGELNKSMCVCETGHDDVRVIRALHTWLNA